MNTHRGLRTKWEGRVKKMHLSSSIPSSSSSSSTTSTSASGDVSEEAVSNSASRRATKSSLLLEEWKGDSARLIVTEDASRGELGTAVAAAVDGPGYVEGPLGSSELRAAGPDLPKARESSGIRRNWKAGRVRRPQYVRWYAPLEWVPSFGAVEEVESCAGARKRGRRQGRMRDGLVSRRQG